MGWPRLWAYWQVGSKWLRPITRIVALGPLLKSAVSTEMGSCQLLLPLPPQPPPADSGRRLGRRRHPSLDILRRTHPVRKFCLFASPAPVVSSPMEAALDGSGMKLLFVEMGVGYDQHGWFMQSMLLSVICDAVFVWLWRKLLTLCCCSGGGRQDITVAAMRACRDAISSNSIPAFRRGMLISEIVVIGFKVMWLIIMSIYANLSDLSIHVIHIVN